MKASKAKPGSNLRSERAIEEKVVAGDGVSTGESVVAGAGVATDENVVAGAGVAADERCGRRGRSGLRRKELGGSRFQH